MFCKRGLSLPIHNYLGGEGLKQGDCLNKRQKIFCSQNARKYLEQKIFLTTEIIINDYYINKLFLKMIEFL